MNCVYIIDDIIRVDIDVEKIKFDIDDKKIKIKLNTCTSMYDYMLSRPTIC